jgi:hypothetical protein
MNTYTSPRLGRILRFALAFLLWGILPCPDGYAQGAVCFSEDVAGKMVMELERTANLGKQVVLLEQRTAEMQAQLDILKETIRIQKGQVDVANAELEAQQKLAEAQDVNCQRLIKAAEPTFMDNVKNNVIAGGVGTVLAIVAILLL